MSKNSSRDEAKAKKAAVVLLSVVMAGILMFSLNRLKTNNGESRLVPVVTSDKYSDTEGEALPEHSGILFETEDNGADEKSDNTSKTESTASKKTSSS